MTLLHSLISRPPPWNLLPILQEGQGPGNTVYAPFRDTHGEIVKSNATQPALPPYHPHPCPLQSFVRQEENLIPNLKNYVMEDLQY